MCGDFSTQTDKECDMTINYDPSARFNIEVAEEIYHSRPNGDWPSRLYQPQGTGSLPTLLNVHGSAWSSGGCLNNKCTDRTLTETGIVVAAIP